MTISPEEKRKRNAEYMRNYMEKLRGRPAGNPGRPANTAEVLWSKVDVRGDDECWPWKGMITESGYGRTWIGDKGYYAHRVIFDLANPNTITLNAPKNRYGEGFLMHSCDNPACCNPKHLSVCTHKKNMEDKVKKGRSPDFKNGKSARCLLTLEQAEEARRLHREGATPLDLSKQFGLSRPAMYALLRGRTY